MTDRRASTAPVRRALAAMFAVMMTTVAFAALAGCFASLEGLSNGGDGGPTSGGGDGGGGTETGASDGAVVPIDGAKGDDGPVGPDGGSCTATSTFPAASSFQDSFDGVPTGPGWGSPSNCASDMNGELVAAPVGASYCFFYSTGRYRLTCDSITVKVPEVTSAQLRVQTFIYVTTDVDKWLLILEGGGFQAGVQGTQPKPMTIVGGLYDPSKDLWWRIREASGQLYFETSPDGVTWNLRGYQPDPFVLDGVFITLGAGMYGELAPNPGRARFDCYNMPAPCP